VYAEAGGPANKKGGRKRGAAVAAGQRELSRALIFTLYRMEVWWEAPYGRQGGKNKKSGQGESLRTLAGCLKSHSYLAI